MSQYLGDLPEDFADLNFKFITKQFSTGIPFALVGGVVSIYKSNSVTEITAGITLTTPFDGKTGFANVKVDLSDAAYVVNEYYEAVLTAGTVDSISVVGTPLANFSIEIAGGSIALLTGDNSLADIEGKVDTAITDIGNLNNFNPATEAVANVTLVATTTTNTDMRGTDGALTDKAGFSLSTAGILAIWNQLTAALSTASTIGKLLVDNINATISSRMAETSISTTGGKVDGVVLVDTTTLNSDMRGTDGVDTATMRGTDGVDTATMRGTDGALTDKAGFSLSTAGILAIWNQLTAALTTASTIGKLLVDNINATISSRSTATAVTDIQNRLPASLVSGKMDSDSTAIGGSTAGADNLKESAELIIVVTVTGGGSATTVIASGLSAFTPDNILNSRQVYFKDGPAKGATSNIIAFDAGTEELTFGSISAIPVNGNTLVLS